MHFYWIKLIVMLGALSLVAVIAAGAEVAPPPRPAVDGATPIAECNLRTLKRPAPRQAMMTPAAFIVQPAAGDPLDDYANRREPDPPVYSAELDSPWMRLLVLARQQPRIVDLAIFVDGKPFRAARESWIDGLVAGSPREPDVEPAAPTQATNVAAPADELNELKVTANADDDVAATEPGVSTRVRSAPTLRMRLADYAAAAGGEVDREELRWLVAEWGGGPGLLMLAPSRTWEHAGDAPLWVVLDENADGTLSAAEIAAASDRLRAADRNDDDVITLEELRQIVDRPGPMPSPAGYAPLVVLDATADEVAISAALMRVYGEGHPAPPFTLSEYLAKPADASLRVDFSAGEAGASGVKLLHHAAAGAAARPESIDLQFAEQTLEFSAATSASAAGGDEAAQLALGAVFEGRLLWNSLDRNHDGRLTSRERSELAALLAQVDRDGDGTITGVEMPRRLRIGVTRGPWVHEALAAPVVEPPPAIDDKAPAPPEWFASMDRNKDGDLSREEFLGDGEQFGKFDADADGLLSVAEVVDGEQDAN